MKVAVVGATGKTGQAVTARLLEGGHQARALARESARLRALAHKGAESFPCDLSDPEKLRAAFTGMDGVYYCSPIGLQQADPFGVERAWSRNAFAAAKAAGVTHFVYLSIHAAGHPRGVVLIDTKHRLEVELSISKVPYTILRANWFMDNLEFNNAAQLLAGAYGYPISADARLQPVAVRDIAEAAVRALESGPRRAALEVMGPQALSFAQMTEILGQELGRSVTYRALNRREFLDGASPLLGKEFAVRLLEMFAYFEKENPIGDPEPLRREFGMKLTSFDDYARQLATRLTGR
jgi:uncharacterized protein YbjT (DUF2867 family)